MIIHWFHVRSISQRPFRIFFMILSRNIEQVQRTCPVHVQEWQLWLSYFCCDLPLLYLTLIMHWFSVCYVSQTLFGIFWWYLLVIRNRSRWHVTYWLYKNDNFGFFIFPFLCLIDFLSLLCKMNTLWNILMMLGTNVEQDEMTCCVQERQIWQDSGDICFLFFLKSLF